MWAMAWAANIATNRGKPRCCVSFTEAKVGLPMLSQSVASDSTPLKQLQALENGVSTEQALALFDALPPIPVAEMFGSWRGAGLQTGHPLDGLLEIFGWHGKRFEDQKMSTGSCSIGWTGACSASIRA
jgi:hypothetical protein